MKKACIFTFHNVPNYGAVLQAYALSHYIEETEGYHVDFVDYCCKGNGREFLPKEYLKSACRSKNKVVAFCKRIMLSLYFAKDYEEKYRKFQQFKAKNLSEIPYDREYQYDAVVLGSDQIWNPDITGGFQPEFFGQSNLVHSTVKVSYAVSCGDVKKQDETQSEEMLRFVKKLDFVGVREKSLSDYLGAKGIENTWTLDPTFLLSSDEYNSLVSKQQSGGTPYLLVYELQKSEALEQAAFEIAREKGLEVRILSGYVSYVKKKTHEIRDAGPIEFLSLVKNADYILTNSFHGTAFSVIYRKDFNVVLPSARTSRIVDLLNEIGLGNRIVERGKINSEHIDYEKIEDVLQKLVASSQNFLRKALGGEQIE